MLISNSRHDVGMIAVADQQSTNKSGLNGFSLHQVPDERRLFDTLIRFVRSWDPDILIGYEINTASWGYMVRRAESEFKMNMCEKLARIIPEHTRAHHDREQDAWGFKKQSSLHSPGRIYLNVWRTLRHEVSLTSYTLENFVFHILHQRSGIVLISGLLSLSIHL
jgi:DNA polymerase zeta